MKKVFLFNRLFDWIKVGSLLLMNKEPKNIKYPLKSSEPGNKQP